ncbi:iron-containing alcohol dehydrogenase [Virgibacillus siamensis]|uniref:iron-containing alcohol dehydrogenase n=1 Tax=Virgibacillus siamensis TaxID=480071 RepID=UPI0009872513|nr:iron-containing alcohol dehydrogenase [Virgibacillus siamensis]
MENFTFQNPVKLIFGKDQLGALPNEISKYGNKILLLYGGGSIKKNGVYDRIMESLAGDNLETIELSGVEPNPKLSTIKRAVDVCKSENIDFILAVGGGSVIDAAKAVAIGAQNDADVWDLITKKERPSGALPFGTVVTLASAGSEMNASSVITNWETKEKKGWSSPFTYSKFSILDPTFTYSVPPEQTTFGIVDIMAHVLENYFHHSLNTPVQDGLCETILKDLLETGPRLLENPDSYALRETVMLNAVLARNGMLNMGSKGDWATHDLEHAVSAIHDIPHAGGISILFPNWMKHVLDEQNEARFKQLAVNVFSVSPEGKSNHDVALEGIEALRNFWNLLGAPQNLSEYNLTEEEIEAIADKSVEAKPAYGKFKKLTRHDSFQILKASL